MVAPPTLLQQQPTPLSLAQAPIPQADLDRKRDQKEAWKAYHGAFTDPLKVEKDQPNDNVKPNRCAPIVDKGVSFLFGPVLKVTAQDKAQQAFLDGFLGDDDDRMTQFSLMAMNGGVTGMNFVKLIPVPLGGAAKYPRLVILDPEIVRVVTAPDDCSLHLAYVIEYPGYGDWQKRQIIARVDPENDLEEIGNYDPKDTWSICTYVRRGSGGLNSTWQQVGEPEEWPYPFPPIVCNQNLPNPNEVWGIPDLTPDLIRMNKVLNFIESNIARIIKFYADPKLWAKGVNAEQIRMSLGEILVLESPDAVLNALQAHGDLAGSLNYSLEIRANMDERSRVPAVALGRLAELPKGNISGVALQLLFQPLIEKTTLKRRMYGAAIRAICRAALVIAGMVPLEQYEEIEIDLPWSGLLPIDDLAAAQTSLIYRQLGVSDATIMEALGFDPNVEGEKSQKEDERKLAAFSKGQGLPMIPPNQQQQQNQPAQAVQQDTQQQQAAGMGSK